MPMDDDEESAPTAGTSAGTSAGDMFRDGQEFIAFEFGDVPDEGKFTSTRDADDSRRRRQRRESNKSGKGKEKMREELPVRETPPSRSGDQEMSRRERRERDKEKRRERDRSHEREWDKGKDRDRFRDGEWRRDRSRNRGGRSRSRERERNRDDRAEAVRANGRRKRDYDLDDGYANKKQRIDAHSRKAPWLVGIDWGRSRHVAEILHKEVEAFVRYISPSPIEHEIRGLIIELITKTVVAAFPDASVHPFGSYETRLYLPLGDIDLVVLSQSMAYSNKVTVLHALANAIKRARITERVSIIAKAKVPIVKFVTTHGRFNVDISINQENGMISGGIINGFLKNMHGNGSNSEDSFALRSLVMITKAFLSQRSMNEVYSGGLGSYSIVCLAISFLQMHPKIRRGEIDANRNLGVLLMEFFELYGCYFNYMEVGISVRDGGTYFSKRQRGWYDYYKGDLLSIEDPADPSNDISKGSFAFQKVRATFAGAHGILTSTAYLVAGILNARWSGRSVHLRDRDAPEELSILSSVMGVTQETINHRRLVQELHDGGVLHGILGIGVRGGVAPAGGRSEIAVNGAAKSMPKSDFVDWDARVTEEEEDQIPRKRHLDEVEPGEDEDEGRYGIGRQSRKLRRTGYERTVFITDEEEEDSLADEEGHYASDTEKNEMRRSYWISKGIGT